jgi:SAM-dependent methyltransferase
MDQAKHSSLLTEQIAYYQARAGEYDEWFLRQGRYDRGPQINQRWFAEIDTLRLALADFNPQGLVLELACGTGLWTQHLLPYAAQITAVDASPEVLEINRQRTQPAMVRYLQADLFRWQPEQLHDVVFFSFWLSHVPPQRLEDFWKLVDGALKPGGRVFFIDSQFEPSSTARDHRLTDADATVVTRKLNDGREYRVVKVFYWPDELEEKLQGLGWSFSIKKTANYFLYGQGARTRQKMV